MAQRHAHGVDLGFDYTLHRSAKRRTLEVQIRGDQVVVRAPSAVSLAEINGFLRHKSVWIKTKLSLFAERSALFPPRQYRPGTPWWFKGERLSLAIEPAAKDCVAVADSCLQVQVSRRKVRDPQAKLERLISHWYQAQAEADLGQKAKHLSGSMGLAYSQIKLRKTRSRWGHCTLDGVLQFNWLIMQAPEPVIDYLVAHEVCHLRHFHHGAAFWSLVADVCPHYKESKLWLKQHGHCLWF